MTRDAEYVCQIRLNVADNPVRGGYKVCVDYPGSMKWRKSGSVRDVYR